MKNMADFKRYLEPQNRHKNGIHVDSDGLMVMVHSLPGWMLLLTRSRYSPGKAVEVQAYIQALETLRLFAESLVKAHS
jgi:hypothetical protein